MSSIVADWTLFVLQTDKRESVLSVALEHGLVGFIMACISQWSTAGDISATLFYICCMYNVHSVYTLCPRKNAPSMFKIFKI